MMPIVVVSGLPRSGTSMMMKMLEAAGVDPITDGVRAPDADNPGGYYEFEPVKDLAQDRAWLAEAGGRSIKVVSRLLTELPDDYRYSLIFMRRHLGEILASQQEMLIRRGKPSPETEDDKMGELFQKHLDEIEGWLRGKTNFRVHYVSYNALLDGALNEVLKIREFLGMEMNLDRMVAVVDPNLYRRRSPC